MYNKMYAIFYNAISDEISVENDVLKRLGKTHLRFTPLRVIKTVNLIEKYRVGLFIYSILCLIFVFVSPIYFLIKLFKNLKIKKNNQKKKTEENLILVANGRVNYLYNKLDTNEEVTYININQSDKKNYISYKRFLKFSDYFSAYIYSLFSIFYLLYKLKNKTDILQVYVAFEWFLVYISLNRVKENVKKVYFANHYDRWAVMFVQLFEDKEVILIQHGILSDDLHLDYKLRNINTIYCYDEKSKKIFKDIFSLTDIKFKKINLSLSLSKIESDRKSILIIGQPHCVDMEIEIIESLKNDYEIYVKPHPLYNDKKYKNIENINIIDDRNFYPKVSLALCYESTLGLEYEASRIKVIWWKNIKVKDLKYKIERNLFQN